MDKDDNIGAVNSDRTSDNEEDEDAEESEERLDADSIDVVAEFEDVCQPAFSVMFDELCRYGHLSAVADVAVACV